MYNVADVLKETVFDNMIYNAGYEIRLHPNNDMDIIPADVEFDHSYMPTILCKFVEDGDAFYFETELIFPSTIKLSVGPGCYASQLEAWVKVGEIADYLDRYSFTAYSD